MFEVPLGIEVYFRPDFSMTTARFQQRNQYEGNPPRPWVFVRLAAGEICSLST
ncbi:MAG TPA: hypothetical protein VFI31_20030 [Pirellulales bacterium]|nr:hypothetical protein [Pirellulales bacterium]